MDLVLHAYVRAGVPVLSVGGEVDLATVPRLRGQLVRMAAEHPGATGVVDLAGLVFIDSAGLGVLVGALGRMRSHGGDLVLASCPPRLVELLALTGLDRALVAHPTVEAAVSAAALP